MQAREVSGKTGLNWYVLARLFGRTLNEEEFKERNIIAQCVCVPMPEWNCVCSYLLHVVALFWHVVVSWLANEDSIQFELGQQPNEFFNSNYLFGFTCFVHAVTSCDYISALNHKRCMHTSTYVNTKLHKLMYGLPFKSKCCMHIFQLCW